MSILFALALAATPAAQPTLAAAVDHSQHAQHKQHAEHQQHMKQCMDMMAKMHPGMKHDGHLQGDAQHGPDHGEHAGD